MARAKASDSSWALGLFVLVRPLIVTSAAPLASAKCVVCAASGLKVALLSGNDTMTDAEIGVPNELNESEGASASAVCDRGRAARMNARETTLRMKSSNQKKRYPALLIGIRIKHSANK